MIATRDPRAYRAKLALRAKEQALTKRKEAADLKYQLTRCYEEHNPPQIKLGLEMIRTCATP